MDFPIYKIVAEGGMSSTSVGEGRLVPAVIIDIEERDEVWELIQLHKATEPGDTILQWSAPPTLFSPKKIYLNLHFTKPMKVQFGIEFELSSQYSLIDGIILSRALYLMSGKSGDKVSQNINNSILIEVPNLGFDGKWNELLNNLLKKKYRAIGVSKKNVQNLANEHIKSMREIWYFRRNR